MRGTASRSRPTTHLPFPCHPWRIPDSPSPKATAVYGPNPPRLGRLRRRTILEVLNHRGAGDARAFSFGPEVIVKPNGQFYYLTEDDLERLDVLGFRTDLAHTRPLRHNIIQRPLTALKIAGLISSIHPDGFAFVLVCQLTTVYLSNSTSNAAPPGTP